MPNKSLEYAKITHPYHPLNGQSFPILKARRYCGVDTFILKGTSRITFVIEREWTDQADPPLYKTLGIQPPILEPKSLLILSEIVSQLDSKYKQAKEKDRAKV